MNTATQSPTRSSTELERKEDPNVKSTQDQAGSVDNESQERRALLPPVDVIEDDTGITLFADMPGVAKDKLSLQLDGDQLVIEGEMALKLPEKMSATHAELQLSNYRRSFTLSKELDPENIQAECRLGVLKLRIPKAKHAQPRKIAISVN
ncbi:MAG: Hsp20/alpha crystallin family protein [Burkholderiaceae bacterium]